MLHICLVKLCLSPELNIIYFYLDTLLDISPLPLDVRLRRHHSNRVVGSYHYHPSPRLPRQTALNSSYSISGLLQQGAHSGSRKSVRFSEHIGFRQIPSIATTTFEENVFEKLFGKLKSFSFNRSRPLATLVYHQDEPAKSAECLFCLPKKMLNRRYRSVSPIQAAVWDSGRRLRQISPSPGIFKRSHSPSFRFRRSKENFSFSKWTSQPSLKTHQQQSDLDLAFKMPVSKMESVYMSDEGYVGDNLSDDWDGYEKPQVYLSPKRSFKNIYESVQSIGLDEDYEFDDYVVCGNQLLNVLKAHKFSRCREIGEDDKEQAAHENKYRLSPIKSKFSDSLSKSLSRISIPDWVKGIDTSIRTPSKLTDLQERVAKSLNRLGIPEWMKNLSDPNRRTCTQKPSSARIPRFPRYFASDENANEAIYIKRTIHAFSQ